MPCFSHTENLNIQFTFWTGCLGPIIK